MFEDESLQDERKWKFRIFINESWRWIFEDEYLKMNGNERLEFKAQGPGDTIQMRRLSIMSFLEH